MRTTLTIDDDVFEAVRSLARAEGASVGTVLSRPARRGLHPPAHRLTRDFPTFPVPADAPPITPADVARAIEAP